MQSKTTVQCRRYYADEMDNDDFERVIKAIGVFNDAKMNVYNVRYDMEYNKEKAETLLKGRNIVQYIKEELGFNDYYTACLYSASSGVLLSQKELKKLNIKNMKADLKERNIKLNETAEKLNNKLKIKKALTVYTKTGVFHKPYPRCTLRIKDGLIKGYKVEEQTVNAYEQELNRKIRKLRNKKKHLALGIQRVEEKLQKVKTSNIKRAVFGSRKLYKKKDTLGVSDAWRKEFYEARHRSMTLPGRHTSKHGNFLVKYIKETKELLLMLPFDEKPVVFHDFSLSRWQEEFLSLFELPPEERKAICYSFKLMRDGSGRRYIVPSCTFELPERTGLYGFANGVVGADLNVDHLALSCIGEDGVLEESIIIPFDLRGKTSGQSRQVIGDTVAKAFAFCEKHNRTLAIEYLDLKQAKQGMKYKNKKKNRKISSFAYAQFKASFYSQAYRKGFELYEVDPAYTSFIGKIKFMRKYGISIHQAASYAIGLKAMNHSLVYEVPDEYRHLVPDDEENVWKYLYKFFGKIRSHAFYLEVPKEKTAKKTAAMLKRMDKTCPAC